MNLAQFLAAGLGRHSLNLRIWLVVVTVDVVKLIAARKSVEVVVDLS